MFGLLNIDKPAGLTSRDVVNRVQRLVRPLKAGHAGTLDPLATGVLVVAIGQATRLVEYVQQMPKSYQATFLLGRTSDTEDIEGQVEELSAPHVPTLAQIEAALPRFLGEIDQRPPLYSALKVAGSPAYKMARRGEPVELASRKVEIYSLQMVRYAYPELELVVECGSGTYIRSLGRDLAESLGTGAVMSALRRMAIGTFHADDAIRLDDLSLTLIQERLLPAARAIGHLPQIVVDANEAARLACRQTILDRFHVTGKEIAALSADGQLVAMVVPTGRDELRPDKCFVPTPGQ
jgi:tRNA pseudouridine55 synthase